MAQRLQAGGFAFVALAETGSEHSTTTRSAAAWTRALNMSTTSAIERISSRLPRIHGGASKGGTRSASPSLTTRVFKGRARTWGQTAFSS